MASKSTEVPAAVQELGTPIGQAPATYTTSQRTSTMHLSPRMSSLKERVAQAKLKNAEEASLAAPEPTTSHQRHGACRSSSLETFLRVRQGPLEQRSTPVKGILVRKTASSPFGPQTPESNKRVSFATPLAIYFRPLDTKATVSVAATPDAPSSSRSEVWRGKQPDRGTYQELNDLVARTAAFRVSDDQEQQQRTSSLRRRASSSSGESSKQNSSQLRSSYRGGSPAASTTCSQPAAVRSGSFQFPRTDLPPGAMDVCQEKKRHYVPDHTDAQPVIKRRPSRRVRYKAPVQTVADSAGDVDEMDYSWTESSMGPGSESAMAMDTDASEQPSLEASMEDLSMTESSRPAAMSKFVDASSSRRLPLHQGSSTMRSSRRRPNSNLNPVPMATETSPVKQQSVYQPGSMIVHTTLVPEPTDMSFLYASTYQEPLSTSSNVASGSGHRSSTKRQAHSQANTDISEQGSQNVVTRRPAFQSKQDVSVPEAPAAMEQDVVCPPTPQPATRFEHRETDTETRLAVITREDQPPVLVRLVRLERSIPMESPPQRRRFPPGPSIRQLYMTSADDLPAPSVPMGRPAATETTRQNAPGVPGSASGIEHRSLYRHGIGASQMLVELMNRNIDQQMAEDNAQREAEIQERQREAACRLEWVAEWARDVASQGSGLGTERGRVGPGAENAAPSVHRATHPAQPESFGSSEPNTSSSSGGSNLSIARADFPPTSLDDFRTPRGQLTRSPAGKLIYHGKHARDPRAYTESDPGGTASSSTEVPKRSSSESNVLLRTTTLLDTEQAGGALLVGLSAPSEVSYETATGTVERGHGLTLQEHFPPGVSAENMDLYLPPPQNPRPHIPSVTVTTPEGTVLADEQMAGGCRLKLSAERRHMAEQMEYGPFLSPSSRDRRRPEDPKLVVGMPSRGPARPSRGQYWSS